MKTTIDFTDLDKAIEGISLHHYPCIHTIMEMSQLADRLSSQINNDTFLQIPYNAIRYVYRNIPRGYTRQMRRLLLSFVVTRLKSFEYNFNVNPRVQRFIEGMSK